jgi:hypothetical protein
MGTPSTPRREHLDIDHDRVLDDELEIEPIDELPDHLDLPIDVPEADALEQQQPVPTDGDDDRR